MADENQTTAGGPTDNQASGGAATDPNEPNNQPSGQGQGDNPAEPSPESEPQGDTVKYESYKKAVSEKKKRDQQVQELTEKLKEYERKEAEREGNYQQTIDSLRKELDELKESRNKEREQFVWNTLESQFHSLAKQEGCIDPDALLTLSADELNDLEVDQNLKPDQEQLQGIIRENKNKYHYLFKKNPGKASDAPPAKGNPEQGEKVKLGEMNLDQLKELHKKAYNSGG